ncbi:MAG: hypothetical protein IJ796_10665 [Lachnospiraceae bacterium]|nr:hypothetical protein [Lachnospiraceae bacterium]
MNTDAVNKENVNKKAVNKNAVNYDSANKDTGYKDSVNIDSGNALPRKKPGLKEYLRGFIPQRVSNGAVVGFLRFTKGISKPFTRRNKDEALTQLSRIENHLKSCRQSFIENQNDYTDVGYGAKTMQYSGCGVFAVYNALVYLNKKTGYKKTDELKKILSFPPAQRLSYLIKAFEKNGIVFSGNLGTSPKSIRDFFAKLGLSTVMTSRVSDFDRMGEESDTLILMMYNDRENIFNNVHTINISKDGARFTAHNVYANGRISPPGRTVGETIKNIGNGKAKGICLIGISVKE